MSCDRNVTQEVAKNAVSSEELAVNIKRLQDLTKKLKNVTDCDAIKIELEITGDEIKNLTKDVGKESKKIADKYLPILKIPTNPLKIIPWVKKLVTGTIVPQLDAYIKLTQQLIQLTIAVGEFVNAAGEILPKLKECALDIVDEQLNQAKGEIEKEVKRVKKKIKDDICGKAETTNLAEAIDKIKDSIDLTKDLISEIEDVKTSVDNAISASLGTINETGEQINSLIGVPLNVDTSSPLAFQQSVAGGAMTEYNNNVNDVLALPPPMNVTAPVASGNAFVGQTLSCTTGSWSANGVTNNAAFTYAYQWYANGLEIYGANTSTYVLSTEELDKTVYCAVTAQNQVNAEEAKSNELGPVDVDEGSGSLPVISGLAKVGQTLTCSEGTYYFEPKYVAYTWYRLVGTTRIEVKGAASAAEGGNSYVVQSGDVGYTIVCRTDARRFKFSTTKYSNPTAVVTV